MVRSYLLLITIIASHLLTAQSNTNQDCSLSMDIPERFMVISSDEKEVVYRDRKTNGILSLTKVSLTDYEFDLQFTAQNVFDELDSDGNYEDVTQQTVSNKDTEIIVVDWKRTKSSPNRRNDYYTMAMMDVCGHYYNFKYSLPSNRRSESTEAFRQILKTIEQEKIK